MKFEFHIIKSASLFHFASNLTEWHFACRKKQNKYWLSKTGELNKKELRALNELKKLLEKYNYGKRFLGIELLAFPEKKAFKLLEKKLEPDELIILKESLYIMQSKFEIIWGEQEKNLLRFSAKYGKVITDKKDQIINDLESFFGSKSESNRIDVFLLIGDEAGVGGGRNIGKGKITLEIGATQEKNRPRAFSTLWHETIHDLFANKTDEIVINYLENHKLTNEIRSIREGMNDFSYLREALTQALAIYITNKYGKKEFYNEVKHRINKEKNFQNADNFNSLYLRSIIKDYLVNKKHYDDIFLNKVSESYQKFIEYINS